MKPPVEVDHYDDGYQDMWYCDPPLPGRLFTVTRAEWSEDLQARFIYEWKYANED